MSIQNALGYIRRHWRGELSLGISFWINLIGVGIVIYVVEVFVGRSVAAQPEQLFVTALISFVIFRLFIYPWQAVGVLRSCEHSLREYKNTVWIRCAQAIAVLGIVMVFVDGLNVTRLFFSMRLYKQEIAQAAIKKEKTYSLRVVGEEYAYITGSLDPGITKQLAILIDQHPKVTTIVLDSEGGRVYEARGIAALARKRTLTTYSSGKCYSACTIAFAGGKWRVLAPNAELGFHQYKLAAKYVLPYMDVDKELEKDFEFFLKQGIDVHFLEKVFETSSTSMWVPSHEVLLEASVIHEVSELSIN